MKETTREKTAETKDYLDKLIETSLTEPQFAERWNELQLSRQLAEIRVGQGITQEEAAERLGVARSRIAEIERHPGKVSYERIATYAKVFGASIEVVVPKRKPGIKLRKVIIGKAGRPISSSRLK